MWDTFMLCRIFFQNKQKILKYNFIYSSVIKLTRNRKVECDKESATCTYLQDTQLIYQLFQKRFKKNTAQLVKEIFVIL